MENVMRSRGRPSTLALIAAFATVYVVWGSTYWAIRVALESFPPFFMGAVRYLIAGGLMLGWVALTGAGRPTRGQWKAAVITGILLLLLGNGAVIFAEQRAPSGLVALVVTSVPLWMVLLEWLWRGGKRPDRMVLAGLVAGTLGVLLLVDPSGAVGLGVPLREAAILMVGTISWAVGSIWSKHDHTPGSASLLVTLQMLVAGVLFTGASVATGELGRVAPAQISLASVLGLGYLIVFGSIIGFTAYVWLVREASPAAVSTYAYVNPVVALTIGALAGGERLTSRILVAAAILLGAVVLITAGPVLVSRLREARRNEGAGLIARAEG
jgi:drug/metabolite transporter (DMT)-like permease